MDVRSAQVAQEVDVAAARALQGLGEIRQALEVTSLVDLFRKSRDPAGAPAPLERNRAKGVAGDFAKQADLLEALGLVRRQRVQRGAPGFEDVAADGGVGPRRSGHLAVRRRALR